MALPNFTEDMNIIAALPDEPNLDGGLSAAELKAKFDEAGNKIKDFINGALKTAIDELSAGRGLANGAVKYDKLSAYVQEHLLGTGAVKTSFLADGAVTPDKTDGLQREIYYIPCMVEAADWGIRRITALSAVYHIAWAVSNPGVQLDSSYVFLVKTATAVDSQTRTHAAGFMSGNIARWNAAEGVRFEVVGFQNRDDNRAELELVAYGWGDSGTPQTTYLDILAVPVDKIVPN